MRKKKRHHPPPISSQTYKAPVPLKTSFQLVVEGVNQASEICRFIVTKAARCEDNLTSDDFILMWLLLEYFGRLHYYDIYKEKEQLLSLCELTLKELVTMENSLPPNFRKARLKDFIPQIEMSPRAYFGRLVDHSYDPCKFIKLINPNKIRRPKERRFIGVGYRDKGNTVLPSLNACPSWKSLSRSLLDYDLATYYMAKKYCYSDWPAYLVPPEVEDRVEDLPQPIFAELERIHSPTCERPFHGNYYVVYEDNLILRLPQKN